jgi:hypothetical protein
MLMLGNPLRMDPYHRRGVHIIRRGRRLLLEQETVGVTSHIILMQKQSLIKTKGDESL